MSASADDTRDAAILATVRHGAGGRRTTLSHRRALKEKAGYLTGFEHFRRLCLTDLRQAFQEDRQDATRGLKYRRLAWLTLFGHFADHRGIAQRLQINALDRQGNYVCELTEGDDSHSLTDWEKFMRLGRKLGISQRKLTALRPETHED